MRELLFKILLGMTWVLSEFNPMSVQASPWNQNYFPNIPLTTHEGKEVRFYRDLIQGKVVLIQFFYTHCKEMCSAETANLIKVAKLLGDQMGKNVFFYSISIDPKLDSAHVLADYAKKFGIGPGWTFLTGQQKEVIELRKKLGLYRDQNEVEKLSEHSLSLMVGNELTGKWIKRSAFDRPQVLAELLGATLQNRVVSWPFLKKYSTAKKLAPISQGEDLFRARCAACHTLGSQEGVGPGLAKVTERRTWPWLVSWLRNPEELLQKKDPIASALLAQYRVQMPNLGLSEHEIHAVLEFLKNSEEPKMLGARESYEKTK